MLWGIVYMKMKDSFEIFFKFCVLGFSVDN